MGAQESLHNLPYQKLKIVQLAIHGLCRGSFVSLSVLLGT